MPRNACLGLLIGTLFPVFAGCDDPGHGDIHVVVPVATYTYQLTVHNEDPAIREIWLLAEIAPGTWEWSLLDVLDGFASGMWYYDALPGIYYELVVADAYGRELDWAPLGILTAPSVHPTLYTYLVVGGRLL